MPETKTKETDWLSLVRTGRREAPDRIVVHGAEGVGKSTFAADAPKPMFIAPEDGVRHLSTNSFPEPRIYAEARGQLDAMIDGNHDYETLVLDTADWFEALLIADVCKRNGWPHIETPGYGKGFVQVGLEWREVTALLDRCRDRGMQIIVLCHTDVKQFNSPDQEGYSRFQLAMSKIGASILKQWCDTLLFARYETFVAEGDDKRKRGYSSGRRLLCTTWDAGYDAKNRCGLPEELELSWEAYEEARDSDGAQAAEGLQAQCAELIEQFEDDDKKKKARAYVKKQGKDPVKLGRTVDWLKEKLEEAK